MIDIRDKLGKLCGAVQSCAVLSMLITLLQHWSTAWISLCSTIGAVLSVCNFMQLKKVHKKLCSLQWFIGQFALCLLSLCVLQFVSYIY